jgi:hypothetical protein
MNTQMTAPTPTGDPVQDAANRIRFSLVQTFRYTAGTFDLDDLLVREIRRAVEESQR